VNIPSETWEIVVKLLQGMPERPLWLQHQLEMHGDEIGKLPGLESTSPSGHLRPSFRMHAYAADYLDFLRELIAIESRGAEWSRILQTRLTALEPFVGVPLLEAQFYFREENVVREVSAKIHLETERLVHAEMN
jgi:hypothetical protein